MTRLAVWTYDVAIVVFIAVGALGAVTGAFELAAWPVSLDLTGIGDRASYESQQHFLKALELGMGLLLWAVRPWAFTEARVQAGVLAVLWVTPASRLLAWALHGPPSAAFVAVLGLELFAATISTAHTLGGTRAPVARPQA